MADIDISVGELPEAEYFDGESILLVENQGIAERVSGAQIKGFLRSGDGGGGGSGGGVSKASELENDVPFVSADEQSLTDDQKAQARLNIGAATVSIKHETIGSDSITSFYITDGDGEGHYFTWNQNMRPKDGGVWVPQFNEETSMLEWDYYQADELYPVPMPTPIPDKTSDLENDSGFISAPATAAVGQTIVVSEVDADGKPTKWEAAEFPAGGEKPWRVLMDVNINDAEGVAIVETNTFADGTPLKGAGVTEIAFGGWVVQKEDVGYNYGVVQVNGDKTIIVGQNFGVATGGKRFIQGKLEWVGNGMLVAWFGSTNLPNSQTLGGGVVFNQHALGANQPGVVTYYGEEAESFKVKHANANGLFSEVRLVVVGR